MPFALLIIGAIILIAAIRGQTGTLFSLIKSDFTGSGNYLYWIVAILAVGSVGYIKKLQPISDAFLALVLVVLFLSNKGFFSQFMTGLSTQGNCSTSGTSDTSSPAPGLGSNITPNLGAGLDQSSIIPNLSNFGAGVLQMQGLGM